MKTKFFGLATVIVVALGVFALAQESGTTEETTPVPGTSGNGIAPVTVDDWKDESSDECSEAAKVLGIASCGFEYKIDDWDAEIDGEYSDDNGAPGSPYANVITITNNDGYTFDWSSEYEVCMVIVKASTGANIYYYPEGSCGDTELVGILNDKTPDLDDTHEISHVSFCWSATKCGEDPEYCYEGETAWAAGNRYVAKGTWAMYVAHPEDGQSVALLAGQTLPAGTATFNDNGDETVDIVIKLTDNIVFTYDLADPIADNNVKVQDYEVAPAGTKPAPGLFEWKESALFGSQSHTITVPKNNFYGIHLDVAIRFLCEE